MIELSKSNKALHNLQRLLLYALILAVVIFPMIIWNPVSRGILSADNHLFSFFIAIQLIIVIPFAIIIIALIYTINRKIHYLLSIYLSWTLFVFIPIGVALGAYSLYVLKRSEVAILFNDHMPESTAIDRKLYVVSILNYAHGVLALIYSASLITFVIIPAIQLGMPDVLVIICSFVLLLALMILAGSFIVGWAVARRKFYTACRILSALNCIALPLGTAIGIYSLLVLKRHR